MRAIQREEIELCYSGIKLLNLRAEAFLEKAHKQRISGDTNITECINTNHIHSELNYNHSRNA